MLWKMQFPQSSDIVSKLPETLRKPRVSKIFLHQEIRWNSSILCSSSSKFVFCSFIKQKQPLEVLCEKRCSLKFTCARISARPLPDACNYIKKETFLRIHFSQNTSGRLLLIKAASFVNKSEISVSTFYVFSQKWRTCVLLVRKSVFTSVNCLWKESIYYLLIFWMVGFLNFSCANSACFLFKTCWIK